MWDAFSKAIEVLNEVHFPLERTRKRSNEHPWITRSIRRLWKKKIRLYKKGGRSHRWWEDYRRLQGEIEEARDQFVERLLEDGNAGSSFYAATRRLALAAPGTKWEVSELFSGQPPQEICDRILDYFGGNTDQDPAPLPDIPRGDGGLGDFTPARTEAILAAAKKSNSMVDGDPLPNLVQGFAKEFLTPVLILFNQINQSGRWPTAWKTEHLNIIPKNPNPSDLSECRNIRCTSLFSKLLQGQVLKKIREELVQDLTQYEATPKCGAEHMLIDIWDKVLDSMEGGETAAVLLGIDYEKAFNRMEHSKCLEQLETLRASAGSLALVRAFLEDRRMSVRIGSYTAPTRPIRRAVSLVANCTVPPHNCSPADSDAMPLHRHLSLPVKEMITGM